MPSPAKSAATRRSARPISRSAPLAPSTPRAAFPVSSKLAADAAVLVSRRLQHGVAPADLAGSMAWLGDERPASLIGAVVDHVVHLEEEMRR